MKLMAVIYLSKGQLHLNFQNKANYITNNMNVEMCAISSHIYSGIIISTISNAELESSNLNS